MPKLDKFFDHIPCISPLDIRRFESAADIKDPEAFVVALGDFAEGLVASGWMEVRTERSVQNKEKSRETSLRAASRLRSPVSWEPTPSDIQLGREALLEEFRRATNLPLQRFAELAHKSRQQVYKDIIAKKLLALAVGPRGQRLPDWQLQIFPLKLTQEVMRSAPSVDKWTIYDALAEPLDALDDKTPVEAVSDDNFDFVMRVVMNELGMH